MEYLKEYDIDTEFLEEKLDDKDIDYISLYENKIKNIVEYLNEKNINDIEGLLAFRTPLFYNELDTIKDAFDNSSIDNLVELINEDPANFELIGL